jgi:hypothetical protein
MSVQGAMQTEAFSMMYSRDVACGAPECGSPAVYKIAAPWSVGRFSELKSYGLACAGHCGDVFKAALKRVKIHPPSPEEHQGEIGIYAFEKGKHDREMPRQPAMEAEYRG